MLWGVGWVRLAINAHLIKRGIDKGKQGPQG